MPECCYIENLDQIFNEINTVRIKAKERTINTSNWSSTLSGLTNNDVKQNWIRLMLRMECVPRLKAMKLLTAINELRSTYNLEPLDDNALICKEKEVVSKQNASK